MSDAVGSALYDLFCESEKWLNEVAAEVRVGMVLDRIAAAGYHVVQEGQAVVDGRVWSVANSSSDLPDGTLLRWLRPLTDEALDGVGEGLSDS